MTDKPNNGSVKINVWRAISTTLISILFSFSAIMLTGLRNDIRTMNDKIFHHLTNAEMHTLRGSVVSKAQFDMHSRFEEKNTDKILRAIEKTERDLRQLISPRKR